MDSAARTPTAVATPAVVSSDRVAETMRRVHLQLRGGGTPSFEALLALGEPVRGRAT
jgi:hypothetical protein